MTSCLSDKNASNLKIDIDTDYWQSNRKHCSHEEHFVKKQQVLALHVRVLYIYVLLYVYLSKNEKITLGYVAVF